MPKVIKLVLYLLMKVFMVSGVGSLKVPEDRRTIQALGC